MSGEDTFIASMIVNILLGGVWHLISFVICVSVDTSFFDPGKKMYLPHKWERNGRIYSDVLKINKWKDNLPQHIGKDGFSKEHLDDVVSVEYIDKFIMETCRVEWNHTTNCLYTLVLFALNDFFTAMVLTLILLLVNLPFALIQRYNRFRLQKLRKAILRKENKARRLDHKTA